MAEQNTHDSSPQRLQDVLPEVLDAIESGAPVTDRSAEASLRYEEGNNAVLRDAAMQPETTDEERADLAEIIQEGNLAIEALKRGEGHSPTKSE